MKRLIPFGNFLLLSIAAMTLAAQSGNQWDFLSDPSVFRDVHGMLGAYLKQKASRCSTNARAWSRAYRHRPI